MLFENLNQSVFAFIICFFTFLFRYLWEKIILKDDKTIAIQRKKNSI
jgi:hypothetical protein